MNNETLILEAAATVEGVAASLRIIADELAPQASGSAELEAALAAKAAAEEALATAQAQAATAASEAASALTAAQSAITAAQAQVGSMAGQLTGLQEALAAEEIDDLAMLAQISDAQAQIAVLQAALDAANTNLVPPPPVGTPLRLSGAVDTQHGGPHAVSVWEWTAFNADRSAIVGSGAVTLGLDGQFSMDLTAPFAVGDAVPLLLTRADAAPSPFDRTILTMFGYVPAGAV